MSTPNLGIAHLAAVDTGKSAKLNTAISDFDQAYAGNLTDQALSSMVFPAFGALFPLGAMFYIFTGALSGDHAAGIPAAKVFSRCGGGDGGGDSPTCDPNFDPTCGQNCNPEGVEGNSCPPPEPTPEPPPPTPSCSAEIFFRPVKHTLGLANHAFWYVQDTADQDFVIDGGPPEGYSIWKILAGDAPLNDFVTPGPVSARFDADDIFTANHWRTYSNDACYGVGLIETLAFVWPQNTIPYNIFGPNSNSFAHWVGASAFDPPQPPRTVGWNVSIPF